MVTVCEVMSKCPVFVSSSDIVTKARSVMRRHGFRALPVVDEGKLVGILSRRDVLKVTSSKTNILVRGLMTSNIISVNQTDDIFTAAKELVNAGVRQLPVVERTLVGIISSLDILTAFVDHDYRPAKKSIMKLFDRKYLSCFENDSLAVAWDKMVKNDISSLPVLDNQKLFAMISMSDILASGRARISKESGKGRHITVSRLMSTPVLTVSESDLTKDVAFSMAKKRVLRMPVTGIDKDITGVIDISDVLRAYLG